jgi:hypothetical protein
VIAGAARWCLSSACALAHRKTAGALVLPIMVTVTPGLLAGLPRGVAAGRISRSLLVCSGQVEIPDGCYLKRFANRAWRIGVPAA